uniref:DNA repair protein RecN n=1 Tax=uncultured Duncaniella sp. TaxID=2768039 RepID=UPI0026664FB9
TLRREVAPAGRSRAFVNDSPVPLSKLQAVAMRLIDIHSQHQNQLLATPEFQLMVIDTLAGNEHRLKEYSSRYNSLRDAVRRLKAMRQRVEKSKEDEEFTRYQLEQLEELALSQGEQEELENEREVLTNLTAIKNALDRAIASLTGDDTNAVDLIDTAIDACDELDGVLSEEDDVPSRLESAKIEISDIASSLENVNERLAADPGRLEAVEERLNSIYSLCHKHHLNNGDELLILRDNLRAKLRELDNSDDMVAELEKEARRAKALAKETAVEISNSRKEEAKKFSAHLRDTAMPLGMKNLQVDVVVDPADMGPTGIDSVQFMVAFNKNQNLMPVGATASGGEISRLMLSIKTIIASRMSLPSILFDEIDTGVSGDVANRMALMMREISKSIQVTTITHLPQVAAKGDTQYRVYKEDDDHATHTRINQLTPEQRVNAIAEMLGGATVDDAARQAAISLLNS